VQGRHELDVREPSRPAGIECQHGPVEGSHVPDIRQQDQPGSCAGEPESEPHMEDAHERRHHDDRQHPEEARQRVVAHQAPTAQADLLAPPEPQMTVSENPPRALPPGGKILSILERSKSLPSLGVPLNLTDEELALIAAIEAEDLEAARALWHAAAPDGLEELLDATTSG